MINIRYIIKTLVLVLITGTSSVSSLQALDTTYTPQPDRSHVVIQQSNMDMVVNQNIQNLSSVSESVFTISLTNLMQIAYLMPDGSYRSDIKEALQETMNTAALTSHRYKAYLALLTLDSDDYEEWMSDRISLDHQNFIIAIANHVNQKLIGDPTRDTP